MAGRHWLDVVEDLPPLRVEAEFERAGGPAPVRGRELVGQAGEIGLPREEFAEQSEPALAVVVEQRGTSFREEEAVDLIVKPPPGRRPHPGLQQTLEGAREVARARINRSDSAIKRSSKYSIALMFARLTRKSWTSPSSRWTIRVSGIRLVLGIVGLLDPGLLAGKRDVALGGNFALGPLLLGLLGRVVRGERARQDGFDAEHGAVGQSEPIEGGRSQQVDLAGRVALRRAGAGPGQSPGQGEQGQDARGEGEGPGESDASGHVAIPLK